MNLNAFWVDFQEQNSRRESLLLGLAAAFVFLNAAILSYATDGSLTWSHFWGPIVWLGVVGAAHFLLQTHQPDHDPFLLPLLALLTGWGVILLDRLA
ncbi:MAG: hypothetical protein DWQ04_00990, partial [Chloroflexi bacterium]